MPVDRVRSPVLTAGQVEAELGAEDRAELDTALAAQLRGRLSELRDPYIPSWSVMASAVRPRAAASATRSAGLEAPSRKLQDEWQCNSAQAGPWLAGAP